LFNILKLEFSYLNQKGIFMLIAVILSLFILGGLTYHLRKRRLLANDKKPTVTRAPTTPEQAARMLEEYLLEFQRLRALAANANRSCKSPLSFNLDWRCN
jgi:hypothetical protein